MINFDTKNKRISDLDSYINKYYNGAELIEEKSIDLPTYTIKDITNDRNACSLVSLTRLINYYYKDIDPMDIYNFIIIFARKRGYYEEYGTFPNFISEIGNSYFKLKKIPLKCKGIYFTNFYIHVKNQIDKDRPVIMNIGEGYYKNHSLTVRGYKIFLYKKLKIKILEVIDGWSKEKRYIDYSALNGLNSLGAYSFNLIKFND